MAIFLLVVGCEQSDQHAQSESTEKAKAPNDLSLLIGKWRHYNVPKKQSPGQRLKLIEATHNYLHIRADGTFEWKKNPKRIEKGNWYQVEDRKSVIQLRVPGSFKRTVSYRFFENGRVLQINYLYDTVTVGKSNTYSVAFGFRSIGGKLSSAQMSSYVAPNRIPTLERTKPEINTPKEAAQVLLRSVYAEDKRAALSYLTQNNLEVLAPDQKLEIVEVLKKVQKKRNPFVNEKDLGEILLSLMDMENVSNQKWLLANSSHHSIKGQVLVKVYLSIPAGDFKDYYKLLENGLVRSTFFKELNILCANKEIDEGQLWPMLKSENNHLENGGLTLVGKYGTAKSLPQLKQLELTTDEINWGVVRARNAINNRKK